MDVDVTMPLDLQPCSPKSTTATHDKDNVNNPQNPYSPSSMAHPRSPGIDMDEQQQSPNRILSILESKTHLDPRLQVPMAMPVPRIPIDPALLGGDEELASFHPSVQEPREVVSEKPTTPDSGTRPTIVVSTEESIIVGGDLETRGENRPHPLSRPSRQSRSKPSGGTRPARRQTRAMAKAGNAEPLLAGLDDRGRPSGKIVPDLNSGSKEWTGGDGGGTTQQRDSTHETTKDPIAALRVSTSALGVSTSGMARAAVSPRGTTLKRKWTAGETPLGSPISRRSIDERSTIVVAGPDGDSETQDSKRRKSLLEDFPSDRSWVEGEVRGHWCIGGHGCGDCRESMSNGPFGLYENEVEDLTDDEYGEEDFEFIDSP